VRAMYYQIINQMKKGLGQIDHCLTKATTYAQTRGFDVNVLMTSRLAPDQFALVRQVQMACDTAKMASARLTGKDAPKHEDSEKTIDELKARIASVVAWLDQLTPEDFVGAGERVVTQPRWEGKVMSGADYFVEHALPNFYFHMTTTYAILRNNGVDVGKRNFLGALSQRSPA